MNARDLGADFAFAWPRARIGIMASSQAVGITQKAEIAAADDPAARQRELADQYASEHQSAMAAARDGFIDEVIAPSETRDRLCSALLTFIGKRM
jgi:propionyl-CoA carboxylase beta chain